MTEENISQEFRLNGIDEKRSYFVEEKNKKIKKKSRKRFLRFLNYTGHLLILASTVTGCVLISAFASLVSIPVGFASSATTMKIYIIIAGLKSISQQLKKKKKHV